jgi:endothelin-converting enzyme
LTKAQSKVDKENFAKIQDAYQVCTNYTALEEEGLDNLAVVVKDVVSLFPAALASDQTYGKTQDHSAALGNTLAYFESIGIETLQRFILTRNEVNPDEVKLALIPLQAGELYTPSTEEDLREYVKIASELIAAVYPSKLSITSAVKLVDSLLAFQERLKAAYQWSQEVGPPQAELPIAVGQKLAPQLNYEYVVKQLAPKGWTDCWKIRESPFPSGFRLLV